MILCYVDTTPKRVSFVKCGNGLCVIDTALKCVSILNFESVLVMTIISSNVLARVLSLVFKL